MFQCLSKKISADVQLSGQSGASLQVPPPQQRTYMLRQQHVYVTTSLDIGETDPALLGGALKTMWYRDGLRVPSSNTRYTQSVDVLPDGTVSATLVVARGDLNDAGTYMVEASVHVEDVSWLKLGAVEDCREYVEKLTAALGLERIILGSNEVNLVLYGRWDSVTTIIQTLPPPPPPPLSYRNIKKPLH